MKKICYAIEREINVGTDTKPDYKRRVVPGYAVYASEATLTAQIEFVKREAYNGEYTIEDVPDQPHEPTEVERLSNKLDAAIQSNAMLEECLVEMAGVVYA